MSTNYQKRRQKQTLKQPINTSITKISDMCFEFFPTKNQIIILIDERLKT